MKSRRQIQKIITLAVLLLSEQSNHLRQVRHQEMKYYRAWNL